MSRDLLVDAMFRLEAAGYPIVLHVHDEMVAEVPESFGSDEEFLALVTDLPGWAEGLPVAAKFREGERFCKIKVTTPNPEPREPYAASSGMAVEPADTVDSPDNTGPGDCADNNTCEDFDNTTENTFKYDRDGLS